MGKIKRSGEEPFKVAIELDGTASNDLPFFYNEFATAEVDGIGTATIGVAMGGGAMYVMLPGSKIDGPPHLFTIPLKQLAEAMLSAAVERNKTGVGIPAIEISED